MKDKELFILKQLNYSDEIQKLEKQLVAAKTKAAELQNLKKVLEDRIKAVNVELNELLGDFKREGSIQSLSGKIAFLKESEKLFASYKKGVPFVAKEGSTIPDQYKNCRVFKETPKRMYYLTEANKYNKIFEEYFETTKEGQPYWDFKLDVKKISELLRNIN